MITNRSNFGFRKLKLLYVNELRLSWLLIVLHCCYKDGVVGVVGVVKNHKVMYFTMVGEKYRSVVAYNVTTL